MTTAADCTSAPAPANSSASSDAARCVELLSLHSAASPELGSQDTNTSPPATTHEDPEPDTEVERAWLLRAQACGAIVSADERVLEAMLVDERARDWRDCMAGQHDINGKMRGILLDWMSSLRLRLKLLPESFFLACRLVDDVLRANQRMPRSWLQLLGAVSVLLACKIEEIHPPDVRELVRLCDNLYSRDDILDFERVALSSIKFRVQSHCTWFAFLQWFVVGVFEACEGSAAASDGATRLAAAARYWVTTLSDSSVDEGPTASTGTRGAVPVLCATGVAGASAAAALSASPHPRALDAALFAELLLTQVVVSHCASVGLPPSLIAAACAFVAWRECEWPGRVSSWDAIVAQGRCWYSEDTLRGVVAERITPLIWRTSSSKDPEIVRYDNFALNGGCKRYRRVLSLWSALCSKCAASSRQ